LAEAQSHTDARRWPVTRYLIDTNVISATAPTASVRRRDLVTWMDSHSSDLFLSAITVAEIADGIAKARREGAKRKASALSAWLRTVLHLYGDRVLAFDSPRLRLLVHGPILPAAAVTLRALPTLPLRQRLVGMTWRSCRKTSATLCQWM